MLVCHFFHFDQIPFLKKTTSVHLKQIHFIYRRRSSPLACCSSASSSASSIPCGVLGGVSRQDGSSARLLWETRSAWPGRLFCSSRFFSFWVRTASQRLRSPWPPRPGTGSGSGPGSGSGWASGREGQAGGGSCRSGVEVADWVRGAQSSTISRCLELLLSFLPPAARYLVASGSGFAARQLPDELLQAAELIKERRLADSLAQLQVEGAAGQDERRVAVEALQDVAWRERGPPSLGCPVKVRPGEPSVRKSKN